MQPSRLFEVSLPFVDDCKIVGGAEGHGMVRPEGLGLNIENILEQGRSIFEATLIVGEDREVGHRLQGVGVGRPENAAPDRQDLAVEGFRLFVPFLIAVDHGQAVHGGRGVAVLLAEHPTLPLQDVPSMPPRPPRSALARSSPSPGAPRTRKTSAWSVPRSTSGRRGPGRADPLPAEYCPWRYSSRPINDCDRKAAGVSIPDAASRIAAARCACTRACS